MLQYVNIKKFRHLNSLINLWNGEYRKLFPIRKSLYKKLILEDPNLNKDASFVALYDNEPVGFIFIKTWKTDSGLLNESEYAHISLMFVKKEMRNMGIGSDMLKLAISELRKYHNIAILGFGREGKSTYHFLKTYTNPSFIAINDSVEIETEEKFYLKQEYIKDISSFDIIMKSPGIALKDLNLTSFNGDLTSQTELMIKDNKQNMIGITGTKGKSTTSSLIYAILKEANFDVRLIGNIGIPPFDCLEEITNDTKLVCEMSSHQLENTKVSPHISTLLNIYEEHLDHYNSYEEYKLAKVNIFRWQDENDYFVYDFNNEILRKNKNKLEKNIKSLKDNKLKYTLFKLLGTIYSAKLIGYFSSISVAEFEWSKTIFL